MRRPRYATGFTIVDLLIVLVVVTILASLALPTLARVRGDSMVQESMDNLVRLSVAHVLYAADWNGRQVTWTVDDLGFYDNVQDYCDAHGGCFWPGDPGCYPPILAGWGCIPDFSCGLYAYRPCVVSHDWAVYPIGFPDMQQAVDGFGNFRLASSKAFHDYVNGRYYDPTFYAPNDTVPYELAEPLWDDPTEFNTEGNPPIWVSYVLSPAAMFDPDVMRSNAAGGWQNPWDLDYGFQSPGLFQAQYPDLKTQMIEHHWVQDPPTECNPDFDPLFGTYEGCEPYYFNHGIDSTPATLFYDGHVRLLPNTEVFDADQQILKQTDGVDGLWHRGTPFGEDGYYISFGYDGVPLSHHILTTDGILGRDTLGGNPPMPANWQRHWAPKKPRLYRSTGPANDKHNATLTIEGNEP